MMLLNIEYKEPDNMTSRTPVACLQPLQNVFTMGFQYTAWGENSSYENDQQKQLPSSMTKG